MIHAIAWYAVFQLLAFACCPLVAAALPRLRDRGYGLSKTLGFLLFGYVAWILPALGIARFQFPLVVLAATSVAVAGLCAARWLSPPRIPRRHALTVELLFAGVYLAFCILRSLHPEIFWGEKPMDFSFLNYFIRLETLPPQDPWASGQLMRYYYLGNYFFAAIHKLAMTPSAVGYNLALAVIPALTATAAYTAALALARVRWAAVTGALALVALSNAEGMRLLASGAMKADFHLFWATSRVLRHSMANEYPFWSFLFADLHAHVMALPFAVALAALILAMPGSRLPRWLHVAWTALAWSALVGVNLWDAVSYVFLGAAVCLPILVGRTPAGALAVPLAGGLALALAFPLLPMLFQGTGSGWGVERQAFHPAAELLRHYGHLAVPLALGLWLLAGRRVRGHPPRPGTTTLWRTLVPGVLTGCALLIAPLALRIKAPVPDVAIVAASLAALAIPSAASRGLYARTAAVALGVALLVLFGEMVWLADRMNTLFKIHYAAWTWLTLATAGVLPVLATAAGRVLRVARDLRLSRARRWAPAAVALLLSLPTLAALASSPMHAWIYSSFSRVPGPRPTLDGSAYLSRTSSDEKALFAWLQSEVPGTPAVLEAQGESYAGFTRVSMHTGLPTLLGWEHHVKQRGTSQETVDGRRELVSRLYSIPDADRAHALMRGQGIEWVVVGDLERQHYPAEGLAKFPARGDLFDTAFHSGPVTLFRVRPERLH